MAAIGRVDQHDLTLFAFILVLGIVVDDAIIVGENIYRRQSKGEPAMQAAVRGVQEVAKPVTFAILTSAAAFAPMLFLPGMMGKFMRTIPAVVVPVLVFSWIESKLILPAHLGHGGGISERIGRWIPFRYWVHVQSKLARGLELFAERVYQPVLERALRWRYVTVAIAFGTFILTIGLIQGGFVQFRFFNPLSGDVIMSRLTMPLGTPVPVTTEIARRIERAAEEVKRELDERYGSGEDSLIRHLSLSVGEQPISDQQRGNGGARVDPSSGAHLAEVALELMLAEEREARGIDVTPEDIVRRWRDLTGPLPGAVELIFSADVMSAGDAVNLRLASQDLDELQLAVGELETQLASYPGVFDVANSHRTGKEEVKLNIKPEAEALGLTLGDLARQVRQAYYGEEVQRIQRGRDEVKVMVRYPKDDRRSRASLDQMRVRTRAGDEVPFSAVAEAETGRGYASIARANRQRVISVTADVDGEIASAGDILADLEARVLPGIMERYPGVSYTRQGEGKEQSETLAGMLRLTILALFAIYGLMAIPFRSYIQPMIVMLAIPFGLIGAVFGHWLLDYELSLLSLCGLVALAGVVVNDSLVLVDYVNRSISDGHTAVDAASRAGTARFRAIILTSLTTFAGLTPLMMETSVQAQFLVPMAISLAFGVLFSTAITLLMIPAAYVILDDLGHAWRWFLGREKPEPAPAT